MALSATSKLSLFTSSHSDSIPSLDIVLQDLITASVKQLHLKPPLLQLKTVSLVLLVAAWEKRLTPVLLQPLNGTCRE